MAGSLDGGRARTQFGSATTRARPAVRAEPPLRLTRRGRTVLIGFIASTLLVLFWLTSGPGAQAGDDDGGPRTGKPPATVVVGPGETLWEIAERHDPDGDPRITIRRIADLNGLADSVVQPGQRLRLPAG